MERFDIVVTGLDPARPRDEVITAVARRLVKSGAEIEEVLARAPSAIARAVSEEDAQRLVEDLRALGVRVKPRAGADELATPEAEDPEAPPPKIVLSYWSPDEDGYERPEALRSERENEGADEGEGERENENERENERENDGENEVEGENEPPTPPTPILVKTASEWFIPPSSPAAAPPVAPAPPLEPAPPPPPTPAHFGRAGSAPPERPGPPRVFFAELPAAFRLPLRPPLRRAHALAPLLAALATALGAYGLRNEPPLGPLAVALAVTAAVGYLGLVHQIAATCLAATSTGERTPEGLPSGLVDDYLGPGALALVILAGLGALAQLGATQLLAMRATLLTMSLYWGAIATYGALAFSIAAANGSALGYLDLAHVGRVVTRAPLRALAVAALGGVSLGAGVLGTVWAFALALDATPMRALVLDVALLAPLSGLVTAYASALTGAAMGLLLYAQGAPRNE